MPLEVLNCKSIDNNMTTSRRINITTSSNRSLNQTLIKSVAKPVESVLAPTSSSAARQRHCQAPCKAVSKSQRWPFAFLTWSDTVKYSVVQTAKICRHSYMKWYRRPFQATPVCLFLMNFGGYDRWRGLINHFTEINEVTRASFFGPSQSGGLV